MKPPKKSEESSSKTRSSALIHKLFTKILKNPAARNGWFSSQKGPYPEIFFILAEDIPEEERKKLLRSSPITITAEDDLLKHLLTLEKENHQLKSLSLTDELTGLHNKRFFNRQLKIEIARTKRTGQPFCLIFIDLDNFKAVNDTLGHTKGDEFLTHVCHSINRKIRPTDFACRYGGDEFTIIMPATSLIDGIFIAERWHSLIADVAVETKVNVSSSIGIDEYDASCELGPDEFIDKVDHELYHAKQTGKNKISYPGLSRTQATEMKSVTMDEKNALYGAFVTTGQKRKHHAKKEVKIEN
jgi:diguanylate cyclase (GGDEF)-like protein